MASEMEMPATLGLLRSDDIWVCDTAASNHFCKNDDAAINVRDTNVRSQGMTGEEVTSSSLMDFMMTHFSKTGEQGETFKLTDVSYNPKHNFNLFNVARCLTQG